MREGLTTFVEVRHPCQRIVTWDTLSPRLFGSCVIQLIIHVGELRIGMHVAPGVGDEDSETDFVVTDGTCVRSAVKPEDNPI